jgi:aldose 1-epimerase
MPDAILLENDSLRLRVSPEGGALLDGFTRDGRPFLRPFSESPGAFDVRTAACFPLVPICNRVGGNAFYFGGRRYTFQPNSGEALYIHGDGWLGRWDADHVGSEELRLSFAQEAPDKSPYVYHAVQTIRLSGGSVKLDLSVRNLGNEALPFGIGFHPYFPRTATVRLQAAARWWWSKGEDHLPAERQPIPEGADFAQPGLLPPRSLDNCYEGWTGKAHVAWPESGLAVAISADAVFSRYMLYAPDADRTFFCLEPMSHTPNALAKAEPLGLCVLQPGEKLAGGFAITVANWSEGDG